MCGVLDLVEQALPLGALLGVLLALMQLPVATQYQEEKYLHAEHDSSRRERSGKLFDALVLVALTAPLLVAVHAVLNVR